jgi:hypothetical protein
MFTAHTSQPQASSHATTSDAACGARDAPSSVLSHVNFWHGMDSGVECKTMYACTLVTTAAGSADSEAAMKPPWWSASLTLGDSLWCMKLHRPG